MKGYDRTHEIASGAVIMEHEENPSRKVVADGGRGYAPGYFLMVTMKPFKFREQSEKK